MKKLLLCSFLVLCLSGCGVFHDRVIISQKYDLEEIVKTMQPKSETKVKISDQERIKAGKNSVVRVTGLNIYDVVKLCFSDVLQVPFTVDTEIRQMERSIDIDVASSISKRQFYDVVKKSLNMIGIEVEEKAGVFYIRKPLDEKAEIKTDDRRNIYIESLINQRASEMVLLLTPIVKTLTTPVDLYPDDEKNILIISSGQSDYLKVKTLIHELDIPQRQIFVEIVIIESTETEDRKNGLMFYLSNSIAGFNSLFDFDLLPSTNALQYSLVRDSGKFNLLLSFLNQQGIINLVSNPYLVVGNNKSASLNIGTEVPILTSTKENDSESLVTEIAYRKTGIVININPVIIGDKIKLNVYIESSSAQVNATSLISSPSIQNRSINTEMLLADNNAFVIGGIKENVVSDNSTGFPFVSPVLKNIFNYNELSGSKVELLIMLRAYIVASPDDSFNLSTYLKGKNHVN